MIARAAREQIPELRALWASVFRESAAYLDAFFTRVFIPENTLVWTESGRVVSALYILPYRILNRGETLRAAYLYALATEPAWRGRKIMSQLIEESFRLCAARGYALAMLIPAKDSLFGFYRVFGFENFFDRVRIEKTRGEMLSLAAGSPPVRLAKASAAHIFRQYRQSPFFGDGCVVLSAEQNAFSCDVLEADGGEALTFSVDHVPYYALLTNAGGTLTIAETDADARALGPLCTALCERYEFEKAVFVQPRCFGKVETRRGRRPFAMAKLFLPVEIERPFIGRVLT